MKKKKIGKMVVAAVFVLCVAAYGVSYGFQSKKVSQDEDVVSTKKYLKELESKDVRIIEQTINKRNGYDELDFDIKKASKYFEDTVFMGDSITEYMKEAEILSDSSVLAKKGETAKKAMDSVKILENMQPENIVMLFGMNDLESYSPEQFEKYYSELVKAVKKVAPKSNIVIQEPLSVDEAVASAKDSKMTNENLQRYKDVAKKVAEDNKVRFLPSSSLIEDKSLYEKDGIHLKYNFYKVWLSYLSENMKSERGAND